MGYLVVYGAGFLLPQVGGFQVGQMQLDGDGVFIVGHAYGKIPAPCSVIKATHVPADRRGFGRLQSHKALDEEHAFFTVAVGESVLDGVVGHLFPLAGFFILHIAGAYFVELCLAHIMQQGAQRKAFGAIGFGVKVLFHHHLVDINAVLHQAAGAGAVIAGAGRRGEKIGGLQPFQQAVGALPVDIGLIIFDEFLLVIHSRLLFIFYGYDTTSRPPAQ